MLSQWITHTSFERDGPRLQSFGGLQGEYPLDLGQLRKKLTTAYGRAERLDLLAYVENGEIAHADAVQQVGDLILDLLPRSSFDTLWIFDGLLNHIAFAVCRTADRFKAKSRRRGRRPS